MCWIWENSMIILLISTQKSYFCNDNAIYEFIMKNRLENRKWRHNQRHKTGRDSFAELSLFKTYPISFIFRQIDRAIFDVRGLSFLMNCLNQNMKANYLRSFVVQTHFFWVFQTDTMVQLNVARNQGIRRKTENPQYSQNQEECIFKNHTIFVVMVISMGLCDVIRRYMDESICDVMNSQNEEQ